MQDFIYYTPTKVTLGRGAEEKAGESLGALGAKKALIHFGGGSVERSGLLGRVRASLEAAGIAHVSLGGVEPNPKIGLIREGIDLCRAQGVDSILAIGGGSVIDSAKSIGLGLSTGKDPWDLIMRQEMPTRAFPLGVVLTIAAAGSEMSNSHVVSNPEGNLKRSLNHDLLRPVFALMNPELTYTVSKFQTGCGVVDSMMHTLERYCTPGADNELTDRISEGILVAIKNAGTIAIEQPDDYEARATLMWASTLAHNGLTGCGKPATFPAHKIEHEISGMFDHVAHGAGLAAVFPAWARSIMKHDVRKFSQLATRVFGVDDNFDHPARTAAQGIDAMVAYFRSLGMPTTLTELGVPADSYAEMARKATADGAKPLSSYIPLGVQEIVDIFRLAE